MEAFFAAVKVALEDMTVLLLTEVDGVLSDSVLVNGGSNDCQLVELKCRTCVPRSQEFSLYSARQTWAQCFLGAVRSCVVGVRGGSRLISLHRLTQENLVECIQREDPSWKPEDAIRSLQRRLQWVDSEVKEGADLLLTTKQDEATGRVTMSLTERHSTAVVAVSDGMA